MSSSFIGKVVDNYRIIENLGIGGMGVVFKAIHIKLDKIFALKMIAPGLAMNENFIKRFQVEAKSLAKFEDPNIVRIYDLREYNDQWFIVMEYVDGFNLLDIVRKDGAFPLQNALPILKQMLTAIGHAHSAGIIHRDLKPNNVMISIDGKVKITDFGLAKDQSIVTTTLSVTSGGTLYYMSPEQVRGFQYTDKRSDIYSIGMTFYEMITGTVPFKDLQSDFDIRETIIRKDIIKPTVYNENIPPELEVIVMKSISKEPDDRYQSAEEMLKAVLVFESQDPNIDSEFALMEIPESRRQSISKINSKKADHPFIKYIFFPEKNSRTRVGILGSLFTIILILFIIFFLSENDNGSDELAQVSHFSIISQPSSALIMIGSDTIGLTPINDHLIQSGEYLLKIKKNDYYSIDTTIILQPGNNQNLSFALKPAEKNENIIKSISKSKSETKLPNNTIVNDRVTTKLVINAQVTINSEPGGANVWINGQSRGKTPLRIADLSPGNYQLTVKKDGFTEYSDKIILKSGQQDAYLANLAPLTGSIFVTTDPSSARIFLDGEENINSETPVTLDKISPGKHKIEIQKEGYLAVLKEIDIKQDEVTKESISLIRLEGKLSVQVRPWGSIYIDDNLKKESADTKYEVTLPAEEYKVTVTHPTLGKWEKMIAVNPDNEAHILVNFNRKINLNIIATDEKGTPLTAEIFIDNINSSKSTPAEIITREGLHTITVKKEGYVTSNHKDEIFVDKNTEKQQKIVLKKIE
jgi:serine/threonine protein kinase